MERCPDCDPKIVAIPPRGNGKCSACLGTGRDLFFLSSILDRETGSKTLCDVCSGTEQCQTCGGHGRVVARPDESSAERPRDSAEEIEPSEEDDDPIQVEGSSTLISADAQPASVGYLLLKIYFGICATLFAGYLAIHALKAFGYVSPESTADIWRWLQSRSKTPPGGLVFLLLAPGLLVVGVAALILLITVGLPVAFAVALVGGVLKAEQPPLLKAVEIAGVVTALALYFRWRGRN